MVALHEQACDVWLLTEVPMSASMDGYVVHATDALMTKDRHWAAVAARQDLSPKPTATPHPASAALVAEGVTYCSTVLPWRSSGGEHPWRGANVAERTAYALDEITAALADGPLVWGGTSPTPMPTSSRCRSTGHVRRRRRSEVDERSTGMSPP